MNDSVPPHAREPNKTAVALRKSLRRLVWATVFVYVAVFATGIYIYNVARDNTQGLCAFRNDIAARAETGRKFLHDHPNGTKAFPLGVIKLSIANSERSVRAFKSLSCPPPPPLPLSSDPPKPRPKGTR